MIECVYIMIADLHISYRVGWHILLRFSSNSEANGNEYNMYNTLYVYTQEVTRRHWRTVKASLPLNKRVFTTGKDIYKLGKV